MKNLFKKLYRLENDTKWNYGFRSNRSPYSMRATTFQIFCFRQNESVGNGAMYAVDHGFMLTVEFELPQFIRGRFRTWLVTKKKLRFTPKK